LSIFAGVGTDPAAGNRRYCRRYAISGSEGVIYSRENVPSGMTSRRRPWKTLEPRR